MINRDLSGVSPPKESARSNANNNRQLRISQEVQKAVVAGQHKFQSLRAVAASKGQSRKATGRRNRRRANKNLE